MSKILVFEHQNPDTDAIEAVISFAYLQKELGKETEVVALGTPNEETQYTLDYFNIEAPRIVTETASETNQVMLVDHNESQQSILDIVEVNILAVTDHHRTASFETADPLYYRTEPAGCTSTITYKMLKENNVTVPAQIAGMMVLAIISDIPLFKPLTCIQEDIDAAHTLADIAGINLEGYGLDLLKVGTNLSDKSAEVLLDLSAKSFLMNGKTVCVAQANTVGSAEFLDRQAELEAAMAAENAANNYDLFVLITTNILNSDSELLATGAEQAKIEAAFNATSVNNRMFLPGVVSHKKQVVPQLTEAFN